MHVYISHGGDAWREITLVTNRLLTSLSRDFCLTLALAFQKFLSLALLGNVKLLSMA